jgi:ATP phosphoribosyltransferase
LRCPRAASSTRACRSSQPQASGSAEDPETSRKLIVATSRADLRVVLVRASDVPTYVQHGGADLGVVGLDTCSSTAAKACTGRSTSALRACRMSVAAARDFDYAAAAQQGSRIRVATKFTRIARDHFADKGVHVDLIKLYGSMELAPLTARRRHRRPRRLGHTLKANALVEVEEIMPISARLVVNKAALKLKRSDRAVERSRRVPTGAARRRPDVSLHRRLRSDAGFERRAPRCWRTPRRRRHRGDAVRRILADVRSARRRRRARVHAPLRRHRCRYGRRSRDRAPSAARATPAPARRARSSRRCARRDFHQRSSRRPPRGATGRRRRHAVGRG